jgi:hypothetical protein
MFGNVKYALRSINDSPTKLTWVQGQAEPIIQEGELDGKNLDEYLLMGS